METPGKKFTDLVEIESIQDTDLTVVRNDTGVKKTPMQKLSDYIKKKFIGWVFSDLPTKDKTIPGALKELNSALDNQFNRNLVQISSSTHYPQIIMYRSGQMVYLKCAGVTQKEIASDTELVTAAANYIPEEYRPISDIVAYPNISLDGKQIRLSIAEDGRITFTSPEKLPLGFAVNLHFVYATGKSNF